MINLPLYLLNRAFFRIKEFFRHWYVNGFFVYSHFVFSLLEKLDRVLAFKITLHHFFQPLFGDRTILGHILGFIFRLGRLMVGGIIYLAVIALAAILYVLWMAAPLFVVYKIISGFYGFTGFANKF